MNRRSFLGTIMAVVITPLVAKIGWAKPKPQPAFTKEDVGPWLKRCGGCGDFFPDTVRVVNPKWVTTSGHEMAIYSHGNRVCIIKEPKDTWR